MNARAPDAGALAALALGALLIGFAPIFVRLADVGPIAAAFWRCALAFPVLALLAARGGDAPVAASPGPVRALLIGCGLFFGTDLSLWHLGIGITTVANATLLANLVPLFVAPAAWLLWRERVSLRFGIGLGVALMGTLILVEPGTQGEHARLAGDLLAVASAAFYAGYLMSVSYLRQQGQPALRIMAWSSGTVAVVLLPVAWLAGERLLPGSAQGWAVLAGLALLSHVGGQGLITWSLASLPAAFSAVGLLIQPLAAAAFAWLLLDERFGPQQAAGGAVILAGILWCRLASRPAPTDPTRRSGART